MGIQRSRSRFLKVFVNNNRWHPVNINTTIHGMTGNYSVMALSNIYITSVNISMLSRFTTLVSILFLLVLSAGCVANLTPIQVSEKFWTAIKNRDAGAARLFIADGTASTDDITGNILPLNDIALGRTVIDGDQAWVDTDVEIAADKPFNLSLKTVLLRKDERWKVDYDSTVASISSDSNVARVIGKLSEFSGEFSRELDRSLEEMQRALPQIKKELGDIEENMKKSLPEIRQQLDEFIRQLEEALGKDKEESSPPPRSPREI